MPFASRDALGMIAPSFLVRPGFHRLSAASLAVSEVKASGLSFSESYLHGNLLHLQAYLGVLKLVQMPPVNVARSSDVSKLLHGLTPEGLDVESHRKSELFASPHSMTTIHDDVILVQDNQQSPPCSLNSLIVQNRPLKLAV